MSVDITHPVVKWDRLRQDVAEARSIDDLRIIKDKAEALRLYAKRQKEYALLVLQGLKRMVQRGDWYQGYVIARDITAADNAEIGDVVAAISLAQDIVREDIKREST